MILGLDKLISRLEEVQNSYSLFMSVCKLALDLESKPLSIERRVATTL